MQCSLFVRRPISSNPGSNFNPAFFFFCSKAFSWIIFSILFRASNHHCSWRARDGAIVRVEGWVCCCFSPLLREVFLKALRFSPLLKNQHFQILIPPCRSQVDEESLCGCATFKSLLFYLFISGRQKEKNCISFLSFHVCFEIWHYSWVILTLLWTTWSWMILFLYISN